MRRKKVASLLVTFFVPHKRNGETWQKLRAVGFCLQARRELEQWLERRRFFPESEQLADEHEHEYRVPVLPVVFTII